MTQFLKYGPAYQSPEYPISLDELKEHLTYDGTDHDERLSALIIAATEWLEKETNRAFVQQDFELVLSCWPGCKVVLPRPPLIDVGDVLYFDADNEQQTLDPASYRIIAPSGKPGWIEPTTEWPSVYNRSDAISISYLAGEYPCPELAKHAIKILCGAWDAWREGEVDRTTKQTELGLDRIINHLTTGEVY